LRLLAQTLALGARLRQPLLCRLRLPPHSAHVHGVLDAHHAFGRARTLRRRRLQRLHVPLALRQCLVLGHRLRLALPHRLVPSPPPAWRWVPPWPRSPSCPVPARCRSPPPPPSPRSRALASAPSLPPRRRSSANAARSASAAARRAPSLRFPSCSASASRFSSE